MSWESYSLDQQAHDLVIKYCNQKEALNQAYKMRITVAYGLERFWGEQLRLEGAKSQYWRDTWTALVNIMARSGIEIPNDDVSRDNTPAIKDMADKLWSFPQDQRKVSLAVLTQLCDSIVWWTQRYKKSGGGDDE
ncbi:hypothetical protein [Iningainema tapete]|uniref:Uncharacterized protein n=1 Tax=Iningainema tapete BLCC-T55 TaxID=2748662 RepID=A0A8J6XGA8_9CYAN|nr:hypothetical protein [Iningainema tapete]MBD2772615.1 hypothetical protein [Iningainema tapete BLCC-T55]